jgi:hypothetical protein
MKVGAYRSNLVQPAYLGYRYGTTVQKLVDRALVQGKLPPNVKKGTARWHVWPRLQLMKGYGRELTLSRNPTLFTLLMKLDLPRTTSRYLTSISN